jgi:surfactin synthase thioesterase subunit
MKERIERIAALPPDKQALLLQRLKQKTGQQLSAPLLPQMASDAWIIRYKPNPQAFLRLFCFPYAGGGASLFRPWSEELFPEVEVCSIQPPGREHRLTEAPYTHVDPLVQALAEAIYPYLDKPFAFFGHSMGAMISFELAHQLRSMYDKHPLHLYLAAHRAPHLPNPHVTDPILPHLPTEMFKSVLRLEGTPEQILQNDELMQVLLPTLRADFELCDTYEYRARPPLECSLLIFGGLQDTSISAASFEAWREHTSMTCSLHMLPGSHFFLHTAQDLLLTAIAQDLAIHLNATSIGNFSPSLIG